MAGENNETEGTEPKTFKENFTDFAKNLGSSLNVFKQNVQNAIDGVNESIRSDVADALSKYWAREDDPFGKGEVLNIRDVIIPEFYGSESLTIATSVISGWSRSITLNTPDINGFGIINLGSSYRSSTGNFAIFDSEMNQISKTFSRAMYAHGSGSCLAPAAVIPANGKTYYIALTDSVNTSPYVMWISLFNLNNQ